MEVWGPSGLSELYPDLSPMRMRPRLGVKETKDFLYVCLQIVFFPRAVVSKPEKDSLPMLKNGFVGVRCENIYRVRNNK